MRLILESFKTHRQILAVSPTGSGKTSLFTKMIEQSTAPALILVHRRELATQAANRLREFGVDFGFIMAGAPSRPSARVQIATVGSILRRRKPPAALVVCDEAHLSTAEKSWKEVLSAYPTAKILGVTATPWRLGGQPLKTAYEDSIVVATPNELRALGNLCAYNGFSYKAPDLSGVKITGGDYNQKQSGAAMREPTLVANIVEKWLAHASHLSTVVFAVTVEHSQALTKQFQAAGVRAEHLDGAMSLDQRRAILARVESGATQVLCNVGVCVEGLDIPRLKCCILARPTKSLARFLQMCGRVRRPWNGVIARIHDHAFNTKTHGLPDDDRDYSLLTKEQPPESLSVCAVCLAQFRGPLCTACEAPREARIAGERGELVTIEDAELIEFSSDVREIQTPEERPIVSVSWNVGRVVEGTFESVRDEPTSYGPQKRYLVSGNSRRYLLPGTTMLDRSMIKVRPGQRIRVTHTGETSVGPGRRPRKEFKVEVDDV